MNRTFVIGVAGGSASGKTMFCDIIKEIISKQYNIENIQIFTLDSFYKVLNEEELEQAFNGDYDFDNPNAFDMDLAIEQLKQLINFNPIKIPIYDFKTHSRLPDQFREIKPARVVIVEGILCFHNEEILNMLNLKLFIKCDGELRLIRRIRRDMNSRGRDLEGILKVYERFVKPNHDKFCMPSESKADFIIPSHIINTNAIDVIVEHIKNRFKLYGNGDLGDDLD